MVDAAQIELFGPGLRPRVLSVGELTRELKGLLEKNYERVLVQGEISNLSRPASGHVYFTLKDDKATLNAALFRNEARLLKFHLQNGLQVTLRGRLTIYEPRGSYQILCEAVEPTGVGALSLAFEQLKGKLAAEGLFAAARKRPIPTLPRRIGVVTSPTGAAVRDFLRVLHHRFANLPVLIAPARVQGDGAAQEIVQALAKLCAWSALRPAGDGLDVIVLTRGGGSLEDLWPFNEEAVARAIAGCPIPTVSAVGHEVDFTIADFVADLRCPTPTAAAEKLAPEKFKEVDRLGVARTRLTKAVERKVREAGERLLRRQQRLGDPRRALASERLRLDEASASLERALRSRLQSGHKDLGSAREALWRAHPTEQLRRHERALRARREALASAAQARLDEARERLASLRERLLRASPQASVLARRGELLGLERDLAAGQTKQLSALRLHFQAQAGRLEALSPLQVLRRGYSVAFLGQRVLRASAEVAVGQGLRLLLPDRGELEAQVTSVRPPRSAG